MVTNVGFLISKENLTSGPETRLDHSGLLCGRSFITVKKDRKASVIDIRMETEHAPPISLIKALCTFTKPTLQHTS